MIDTATHAVVGSPITVGFNPQFIAISAVAPPALQGAVSRKLHAAVETFNLPLALAPFNGNDVVVGLTNVTNQQYVTVSLADVVAGEPVEKPGLSFGMVFDDIEQSVSTRRRPRRTPPGSIRVVDAAEFGRDVRLGAGRAGVDLLARPHPGFVAPTITQFAGKVSVLRQRAAWSRSSPDFMGS